MKKKLIIGIGGLSLMSLILLSLWLIQPISAQTNIQPLKGDPNNGAYLARMAGCIACHSDLDSGRRPLTGGPTMDTDFGTFAAPNLTQSKKHGIGNWSLEDFAIALRQGVSPAGEPYYPAFPYEFYRSFSDKQIADLWSAFKTVPAIETPDPIQTVSFPFSVRNSLKIWQALFSERVVIETDPDKTDGYNRGKFIVEGPAHCAACHTPRNFAGALQVEQSLYGSDDLPNGETAPPIDAESLLANGWTRDNLAYALQTGLTPDGDALGGSMGEVILGGTQYLTWTDLMAMSEYLLTTD